MKTTFLSTLLLILFLGFKAPKPVNIWLIGDSTMAWKKAERQPESGWGVALQSLIDQKKAIVHNHAASGRSSRSFLTEKRWQAVLDSIQPGDYVLIQFGHNDAKPEMQLHTDAYTSFKQNLEKYIAETRAKDANPILCSSIVRRHFDGQGNLLDTHGDYVTATRQVAAERSVEFVDMEASTRKLVEEMGAEKSKSLFVFCKPGECPRRPKGVQDSTHLNNYGAQVVASLFMESAKKQKLSIYGMRVKK